MDKLVELIKYSSEGHSLDFKREQYPLGKSTKKYELIKDLIALANHPSDDDKYIMVGVKEKDGVADTFHSISNLTDEAKYQQLISTNVTPKLNFEYKSFEYQGYKLAYFRVFGNVNRPYLFSKNLSSPEDNSKNQFRTGDGYIRVGSSSKKLGREEFDEIYKAKNQKRDRKSSLIIKPCSGRSTNEKISKTNLKYFDINIENQSNQSIDLDVEMKVFKGDNYYLLSEREVWDILSSRKEEGLSAYSGDILRYSPPKIEIPPHSFDTHIERHDSYLSISRSKTKFQKTAIQLSQLDIERDVFHKTLFIVSEQPVKIAVEVIIRSDDFIEGPLIEKFEIDYPINVFYNN